MMAHKGELDSQLYRQQQQSKSLHVKHKAARMTHTSISNQLIDSSDRLQDVLQTYCDYFIRY